MRTIKKHLYYLIRCLIPIIMLPPWLEANVTLPAIFSEHMVLQQNS